MREKKNKSVAFVCESGRSIGYGHLYRSIAIAESFLSKGCDVAFFCNQDVNQVLNEKLPQASVKEWDLLNKEYPKFEAILLDVYKDSFSGFRGIMKKCEANNVTTAIVIDFAFKENALKTDYVFQVGYQTYNFKRTEKEFSGKKVVYYSGNDFLVFRKEFDEVEAHIPKPKASRVLVSMGGSDPHNLSELVNKSLSLVKVPLFVTYIYGSGLEQNRIDFIKRENERSHHKFHYYRSVVDMPSLILKHDLAIINGGNTRFEIAKLGIPFISIAFQQVQKEISDLIADDGIGISLGLYTELKKDRIANVVENVLKSYEFRKKQSEKMRDSFSGNGSDKVYQILLT